MRSSHHILTQVSECRRDAASEVLQTLTDYRQTLLDKRQAAERQCVSLQERQARSMEEGVPATTLLMMAQAIREQKMICADMDCEVAALDKAIAEQRQKWAAQHKKYKAHESMAEQWVLDEQKKHALQQQAGLDEQYASQRFRAQDDGVE